MKYEPDSVRISDIRVSCCEKRSKSTSSPNGGADNDGSLAEHKFYRTGISSEFTNGKEETFDSLQVDPANYNRLSRSSSTKDADPAGNVFQRGLVYWGVYLPTFSGGLQDRKLEDAYQRYSHRQRQKSLILVNIFDLAIKVVIILKVSCRFEPGSDDKVGRNMLGEKNLVNTTQDFTVFNEHGKANQPNMSQTKGLCLIS
ncbi:uncharacterized protein LOC111704196 [Eurytemora carolleeae]|uniref:uncharacterized protein LOC111704196 n=1 Tax=Eurytemora carolleeae TaxID=1294199 RepID=UPI000C759AEB|nr:uncharacterized protein LOC111704196 [Eurytemora carolleeae]|eukprot:XP_023332118.1 uncharacterized protein LOC111704196 [Eurytemora affinis]